MGIPKNGWFIRGNPIGKPPWIEFLCWESLQETMFFHHEIYGFGGLCISLYIIILYYDLIIYQVCHYMVNMVDQYLIINHGTSNYAY
jgi:hypothetical protein